ncbi:MAG: hypothetical protein ACK4U0_19205 [Mesorhizobium sp.]
MPWVRFTAPFDWKPVPQVTIAYQPGQQRNVPTPCATAAVKAGVAVRIKRERKQDAADGKD